MTRHLGPSVSVVIPLYNEAQRIGATLQAATTALERSGFRGRFIVIDDGSSDGSAEAARRASRQIPVTIVSQLNRGRLAARRAGLQLAQDEFVLFLDSRVTVAPDSLRFISQQVEDGNRIWNGHVIIEAGHNPYGAFWNILTGLVFSAYFDNPRTTSYTAADFDAYPKGTTCFFAPTSLMREAFDQVHSPYRDERNANDDTPILRWIATQQPIHISPHFQCTYEPRATLQGFVRHAFHRGVVFVDGHGRRDAGLFPAVVAFYPFCLVGLFFGAKRPRLAATLGAALTTTAGVVAIRRGHRPGAALAFAALLPVYALAHGAGMWRGLQLLAAKRLLRPTA